MPSVNPGPASTSNSNSVAALSVAQGGGQPFPQEQNQIRLLAAAKGVDCSLAGDRAVTKIINSQRWAATAVQIVGTVGATQTPTAAYLGVCTSPNKGAAFTILANAVMTNVSAVQLQYAASANTTNVTTDQTVYINVGTTTASGTVDVLVYGYDMTT